MEPKKNNDLNFYAFIIILLYFIHQSESWDVESPDGFFRFRAVLCYKGCIQYDNLTTKRYQFHNNMILRLNTILSYLTTKHSMGIVFGHVFLRLSDFITIFFIVRILDIEQANIFMLMFANAMIFNAISDFGLRNKTYCEIGKQSKETISNYVEEIYGWKLVLSLFVIPAFSLYACFILKQGFLFSFCFSLIAVNFNLSDPGIQLLRGLALGHKAFILNLGEKTILLSGFLIFFLCNIQSVYLIMILILLTQYSRLILSYAYISRYVHFSWPQVHPAALLSVAQDKILPGFVILASRLYLKLPVLMLPFLGMKEYASVITIVLSIYQAALMIPNISVVILLPLLHKKKRNPSLSKILFPAVAVTFMVGCTISSVFYFFSDSIMAVFGVEYTDYGYALRIIVFSMPFLCANQMIRLLGIAENISHRIIIILVGAIILFMALISFLNSIYGVSGIFYSCVIVEILFFMMMLIYAKVDRVQ